MRREGKKAGILLLISLLALLFLTPTAAAANEQVILVFNGQEYLAEIYLDNGVSYISSTSLAKIPNLTVEEDGYVPLRDFFERRGGIVEWDSAANRVIVSWCEKQGEWAADELVIESTRILQELNTYKMKCEAAMKMVMSASAAAENPQMPEMTTSMEGVFQQKPLAMYMKQAVKIPVEDLDLTEEESALLGQDPVITEMVWKDNAIYQKMPGFEQWIVQDLGDLDMLNNLIQVSPQQSLEMMREFGIIYVFGEDVVINGQEYYTIKNYIDSATYKKVIKELLGDFNLAGLLSEGQELSEEEVTMGMQMIEQLLATMELDYYVDTFINKENLLSEYMAFDMDMKYVLDETMSPEGAISFAMKMAGEAELYDFGTEILFPDISNAITQQEYIEQMMNKSTVE